MNSARRLLALGFVVLAFAGGIVFMSLAFEGGREQPRHATVMPQPVALPAFSLVDDTGAPFSRDTLEGRFSLVFFGFTNCPDICPATLAQLAAARSRVLEQRDGSFPDIILISVDPERDTPEAMAAYVAKFGAGITGVTGAPGEIRKLTAALGVWFSHGNADGGQHTVQHTAAVMVINKNAELVALFGAPHDVNSFVSDIPLLTGST